MTYLLLTILILTALAAAFRYVPAHVVERRVNERLRAVEARREQETRLLTDLSHNLMTPLAILKGKVERFERTMLHDRHVETLGHSIDTVTRFINEILAFSNLERAIREEERYIFSLSELVEEVVEDARTLARADSITVTGSIAPHLNLYGNRERLGDALMNLIGNAVKYMGDGPHRSVHIALCRKDGQFLLSVSDTGMGIPEDELPHIFNRFYRGSTHRYGSVPGTGLGLAFVERIAEEHQGSVSVTSEVGKGSTFTLTLPGA